MAGEIDLQGLLGGIVTNPADEAKAEGLRRVSAMGTRGGMAAYLQPQQMRSARNGIGGMFGLDMRNESEKVKDELSKLGTPQTPAEHKKYADVLDKYKAGSGVQYMMRIAQENRDKQQTANQTAQAAAQTRSAGSQADNAVTNKGHLALAEEDATFTERRIQIEEERLEILRLKEENEGKTSEKHSITSKIRADGTIISMTNQGTVRVTTSDGSVVTGVAAAEAVNASNKFDLTQALAVANAGETARRVGQKMIETSTAVAALRVETASLDQVIEALDEGAYSGKWTDLVPTFSNAQAKLKQAQNELGLSVIGGTTFGSLSEAEMRMALETALPTHLDQEELGDWVKTRHRLNTRLMDDMNAFMEYIATGGDEAGWIIVQNNMQAERLREDARAAEAKDTSEADALLNELFPTEVSAPRSGGGTNPVNTGDPTRRNR